MDEDLVLSHNICQRSQRTKNKLFSLYISLTSLTLILVGGIGTLL
jgi:hypothetical protein